MIARAPQLTAARIKALNDMAPLVAEHRGELDRERRLPEPLFRALVEGDLLRLWLPRSLGGPELSPLDFMEIVETAAELDGSLGWIVGNGAGMSRVAGYLPHDVVAAWFSDPRAFVASATGAIGTALPVTGGYLITGRWPFASGIHHSTQIMALCQIPHEEGARPPDPLCCYVAKENVTIVDTWHVSGLRGTGSCDFTVREQFVPTNHAHALVDIEPSQPGPLFRVPNMSLFPLSVSVVPLGIARSAINCFVESASRKARWGTSQALCDREIVQVEVGRAEALFRAARAFLVEAIEELAVATGVGGDRLIRARAIFKIACSHAGETAARVVDMMAEAAGAKAIFETCTLERCVRDVRAAAKHVAMSPNNYSLAGKVILGLDLGTQRF